MGIWLLPKVTIVILFVYKSWFSLVVSGCSRKRRVLPESLSDMSATKTFATGADWTQLLADPDLVGHLGKLLKVCREAAPEKREKALFEAIREIKSGAASKQKKDDDGGSVAVATPLRCGIGGPAALPKAAWMQVMGARLLVCGAGTTRGFAPAGCSNYANCLPSSVGPGTGTN